MRTVTIFLPNRQVMERRGSKLTLLTTMLEATGATQITYTHLPSIARYAKGRFIFL